jgi:hypothetical protein
MAICNAAPDVQGAIIARGGEKSEPGGGYTPGSFEILMEFSGIGEICFEEL